MKKRVEITFLGNGIIDGISGLRYKSQTSCPSSRKRPRFDQNIHNQRAHEACHRSIPGHQPLTEKFCLQQKPNSQSSMLM